MARVAARIVVRTGQAACPWPRWGLIRVWPPAWVRPVAACGGGCRVLWRGWHAAAPESGSGVGTE
ncbi:hypothetical protein RAA17_03405 [Komagataeibacter rhaeticus]|nr:hypothetical protein [Komagataeibacter rhaeticus]